MTLLPNVLLGVLTVGGKGSTKEKGIGRVGTKIVTKTMEGKGEDEVVLFLVTEIGRSAKSEV